MKMLRDEKKKGGEVNVDLLDKIFKQRYHILTEFESFWATDGDTLELEYEDGQKRELTQCVRDGFYFEFMSKILKKEE